MSLRVWSRKVLSESSQARLTCNAVFYFSNSTYPVITVYVWLFSSAEFSTRCLACWLEIIAGGAQKRYRLTVR